LKFRYILIGIAIYFLSFSANGFSQNSYFEGFIILQGGDTINGYLQAQNSKKASKWCVFKSDKDKKARKYRPADISGYRYKGDKFYISKVIGKQPDAKTVFLEFLLKGKANIYYLKDRNGEHYFIDKENVDLIELTEPPIVIHNDSGTFEYSKYKGNLGFVLSDCPEIIPEINDVKLNYKSLINLTKDYHNRVCENENCIIYERKIKPIQIKYGVYSGYSISRYNFGSKLKTDFGNTFQIGIGANIKNIIFTNDKSSLNIKFLIESERHYLLSPYDTSSYYTEYINYEGRDYGINAKGAIFTVPNLDVNFKMISFRLPIVFNYVIDLKKISLYVGAGVTEKFVLSQNKSFQYEPFYSQYGRSIRNLLVGVTGNLGIDFKLNKIHSIGMDLGGDYMLDPRAMNQYLRLKIVQYSMRIKYTL
jgi:hypothetical protein